VVGLWRTGASYIYRGDMARGIEYCNDALGRDALPFDAAMAKSVRGYGLIKAGSIDAGIADLDEATAWFKGLGLQYTHGRFAVWLAEGLLRRGDRVAVQLLVEEVLQTAQAMGYRQLEGIACWLMAECLPPDAEAEPAIETAIAILGQIGARNDLARALMTRAALRQRGGDPAAARDLLNEAGAIFHTLGTLDGLARIGAARAALARAEPIGLLAPLLSEP
jgi:hypothetical protein